jgi:hypothetical protein
MAYGGDVTARLRLDATQFQSQLAAVQRELNSLSGKQVGGGGFQNLANQAKSATSEVQRYGAAAVQAGNAGSSAGQKIASAMGTAKNTISSAAQALNQFAGSFVSFDIWMAGLVGGALLQFSVGAAMGVERSIKLMEYVGMSRQEVERLNQVTKDYATASSWVSQPEILDAWRIVRLTQKNSGEQMERNMDVMGDTIALFKAQGRSAEDAGRAVEDAMSGTWKRFKEINVQSADLIAAGWSGATTDVEGFWTALRKIYQDRGIAGLAMDTSSLAARWENLKEKITMTGVAIGTEMMPYVSDFVSGLTSIIDKVGYATVGLTIMGFGGAFALSLLLPQFMAMASGIAVVTTRLVVLIATNSLFAASQVGVNNLGIMWRGILSSITIGTVLYAGALAALAAGLMLTMHGLTQTFSAAVAWNNVYTEHDKRVNILTKNKENLNKKIDELNQKRQYEISIGQDIAQTDREITAASNELAVATRNLTQAEKDRETSKQLQKGVEDLAQQRLEQSKLAAEAAKLGITPEQYLEEGGMAPSDQYAMEKTLATGARMQYTYDKMAGTLNRINTGQDTYAKLVRSSGDDFKNYQRDYEDFARAQEKYIQAEEKGDWGGMIREGIMASVFQARVGVQEITWSLQSAWSDFWNVEAPKGVGEFFGRFAGAKELGDMVNSVRDGLRQIKDSLGSMELPAPLKTLIDQFLRLSCAIVGCSPGLIPALRQLKGVWDSTIGQIRMPNINMSGLTGALGNAIGFVQNGLGQIVSFFSGMVGSVGSVMSNIYNSVVPPIQNAMNQAWGLVMNAINSIVGAFWGLVGSAGSAWWSVYDAVMNPINAIINLINTLRSVLGLGSTATATVGVGYPGAAGGEEIPVGVTRATRAPGTSSVNTATWFDGLLLQLPVASSEVGGRIIEALYNENLAFTPHFAGGFAGGEGGVGDWVNVPGWTDLIINSAKNLAAGFLNAYGLGGIDPTSMGAGGAAFYAFASQLFSRFHHEWYFDDQKSNAKVLADLGGNCYDMAQLLVAIGNAFGLSGGLVNGYWGSVPHTWAYISGIGEMDPTAFVKGMGWSPPGSGSVGSTAIGISATAGPGSRRGSAGAGIGNTIIIQGDVYGYDDFVKKVEKANNKIMGGVY